VLSLGERMYALRTDVDSPVRGDVFELVGRSDRAIGLGTLGVEPGLEPPYRLEMNVVRQLPVVRVLAFDVTLGHRAWRERQCGVFGEEHDLGLRAKLDKAHPAHGPGAALGTTLWRQQSR
jgi:hypothetical protein